MNEEQKTERTLQMKMNGMDYVDMHLVHQPIQDFYEMLRKDPSLVWLSENYIKFQAINPMDEWEFIQEKVRRISMWESIMISAIICAPGFPVLILGFTLQNLPVSNLVRSLVIAPFCLAFLVAIPPLKAGFVKQWRELAKGWLNATWKTREFTFDTWELCLAFDAEHGFNLREIREILSSRAFDAPGEIPQHITHMANEMLSGNVKQATRKKDGAASAVVSFADEKRKNVKRTLAIFQSFGIIPPDRSIGYYYRLIEQQSKKSDNRN